MSQTKTCIRMALETGSRLIMPKLIQRNNENLKDFQKSNSEAHLPFGEWFDETNLIEQLRDACPQFHVVHGIEAKNVTIDWTQAPYYNGVGNYAWPGRDWAAWFHSEVSKLRESVNSAETLIVDTTAPLSFFNLIRDPSGRSIRLWNEMNYLMRFNQVPRTILHAILLSLSNDKNDLQTYFGVHFRTEADSPDAWTKADEQIQRNLEKAQAAWEFYGYEASVEKKIYLACGNASRILQFEKAANAKGWEVVDKYRLTKSVSSDLYESLLALPFDHQGMVDLGMMLISDFYLGLTNSAFSFTVAHARDPRGRYGGSSLQHPFDQDNRIAGTHLFDDGEGAYPCCL